MKQNNAGEAGLKDNQAFLEAATAIGTRSVTFQRYMQNSNCHSAKGMARMAGLVALEYLAERGAALRDAIVAESEAMAELLGEATDLRITYRHGDTDMSEPHTWYEIRPRPDFLGSGDGLWMAVDCLDGHSLTMYHPFPSIAECYRWIKEQVEAIKTEAQNETK